MGPLVAAAAQQFAGNLGSSLGEAVGGGGPNNQQTSQGFDNSGFSVATGKGNVSAALDKASSTSSAFMNKDMMIIAGLVILGIVLVKKMKKK